MKPGDAVEVVKAAFLEDMRDRRFLKYLFIEDPNGAGAYGYIESPFDLDVQNEIAESIAQAAIAAYRPIVLEEAARVCEQKRDDFLSPEYATNQPLSSITERFACTECANAIRNLSEVEG